VWDHVLAHQAPGVIVAVDAFGLRIYCEAVVRYVEAAKLLADTGLLIRGSRGRELVRNPLHSIMRDNADMVRLWASELGLTPGARASLNVPASGTAAEDLSRWFGA
jgi:P27 family predicted phage terminase small subunit